MTETAIKRRVNRDTDRAIRDIGKKTDGEEKTRVEERIRGETGIK